MTQSFKHERERREGLAAARMVKVVAWMRRAPVSEDMHEPATPDGAYYGVLGQVGQPEPVQGR